MTSTKPRVHRSGGCGALENLMPPLKDVAVTSFWGKGSSPTSSGSRPEATPSAAKAVSKPAPRPV